MGLLNTMETILTVMEDKEELHAQLEPVVLEAVHHIFTNSIMEFYEEALSLSCDLTTTKVSDNMWKMLVLIYQVSLLFWPQKIAVGLDEKSSCPICVSY